MNPELKAALDAAIEKSAAHGTRIEELKTTIASLEEKSAGYEAAVAALEEEKSARAALEARIDAIETAANRPGAAGTKGDDADVEHKSAFEALMRDPTSEAKKNAVLEIEAKAANVNTSDNPSGKFAVPQVTADGIYRLLNDTSPFRSVARVIAVSSVDYREIVDTHGATSEWVDDEAAARNKTDTPNLAEVRYQFGELAAKPEVSNRSLDDLTFQVEPWLQGAVAERFAKAEAKAFISGDGVEKPKGILTYPTAATGDDERPFGTIEIMYTGAADGLGDAAHDLLIDLITKLKAGHQAGAVFMMNSKTKAVLLKVKDANGQYIMRTLDDGLGQALFGYRVVICEDMPDIAAGSTPIAFGNFVNGYTVADRAGLRAIMDQVTRPGWTKFIVSRRVGGGLRDSEAIKLLRVGVAPAA